MAVLNPDSFHDDDYLSWGYPSLDIRTIAVILGRINRWNGRTDRPWPVLMHSLMVSYLVPEQAVIHALLHDAGEIAVGDVPAPLKSFLISEFEESTLRCIYQTLGVQFPSSEIRGIVKAADIRSRTAEILCPVNTCGRISIDQKCYINKDRPFSQPILVKVPGGY